MKECNRRLFLTACASLFSACKKQEPERLLGPSDGDQTPLQTTTTSATVPEPRVRAPWYACGWTGEGQATKNDPLAGSKPGTQIAWVKDKGKRAAGKVTIKLTPKEQGRFSVQVNGALGTLLGQAQVRGETSSVLHAQLRPPNTREHAPGDVQKQEKQSSKRTQNPEPPIFRALLSVSFTAETKSAVATLRATDATAKTIRSLSTKLQRQSNDCIQ